MSAPLFTNEFVSTSRIIYTPSMFARMNLLYLQEAGFLQAMKAHKAGREGLNSFLVFLVESGKGTVTYSGREDRKVQTVEVSRGDIVFLDCRYAYSHLSHEQEKWSLRWVHFYGPTIGQIYEKYLARGGKWVFTPADPDRYRALLQEIYDIAGGDSFVRDMELNTRLSILAELLMHETVVEPEAGAGGNSLVNKKQRSDTDLSGQEESGVGGSGKRTDLFLIRQYLEENFNRPITLEELSAKFYINKFYLTKIFKEQYGLTVNNYITQLRIGKAKELLRFTDRTIEEISEACGYNGQNFFSRVFKKTEGCSPREYRKSW